MFEKEDSLPGAEGGSTLVNRNRLAGSSQRHSQVARAVVRSFVGMDEVGKIFRDQVIEERMQIRPRFRISIFHDDQAGGRVANEHGCLSGNDSGVSNKLAQLTTDFVGAFTVRIDGDFAGVSFNTHEKLQRTVFYVVRNYISRFEEVFAVFWLLGPEDYVKKRLAYSRASCFRTNREGIRKHPMLF